MSEFDLAGFLAFVPAVLRVTTPILLAALGVLISERAGALNIGVEGMMLSGAFAGVVASAATGSATLGLVAALVAGGALGALLAGAVQILKADLILSGIAINMAAAAGTTLLLFMLTGDKGMSGSLASKVLPNVAIPVVQSIPVLGVLLSGYNVLTYAAFLAAPCVGLFLMRTPFGLHLRAVGESPESAAIAGINVVRVQLIALVASGAFAGAAGAFLSMGYVSWFSQNMSAGRGFIALAAEVMGHGNVVGTLLASLLLGSADAIAIALQGRGLPSELMQTTPYLVPVIALVFYARRRQRRLARV